MAQPATTGFSLARGGPFYALLRKLHLVRHDAHDAHRQAIALIVIGWVPLAIIFAAESSLSLTPARFLWDPSVHLRLLLAVPLFVLAEHSLDWRCRLALDTFLGGRFITDLGAVERIVRSAGRLRDAWAPEILLACISIVLSQLVLWRDAGATGLLGGKLSGAERLSAAHLWYAFVALPLFQFLLGRTVWRWLIWSRLLWQLSRLPLRLMPTHPDLAGGIAILSRPVVGLSIALVAGSSVIAGTWGAQILAGQTSLPELATPFAVFVALSELVALGPLVSFSGQLFRGRNQGLLQYSVFALRYTVDFHQRWIVRPQDGADGPLGSPDIQSLADLANGFDVVQRMRLVPFGPRTLYMVFLVTLVPMLPLFLTEMSLWELVSKIGRALLGGVPG